MTVALFAIKSARFSWHSTCRTLQARAGLGYGIPV